MGILNEASDGLKLVQTFQDMGQEPSQSLVQDPPEVQKVRLVLAKREMENARKESKNGLPWLVRIGAVIVGAAAALGGGGKK